MVDLQAYLLADLIEACLSHCGLGLGLAHLIDTVAPSQDRHFQHYSGAPHTVEFLLKTIEDTGIGDEITGRECQIGHIFRTSHLDLLALHLCGNIKGLEFCPMRQCRLYGIRFVGIRLERHSHICSALSRKLALLILESE